ncbi:MAG: glycosyltransferase, partial [Actinobacteria bacterium]|nr:glycosyltransferase [Actinomycetota bacterium]
MISAIGKQPRDGTYRIAFGLLGHKLVQDSYINRERDLPHIDDFAAARNQSFQEASSDWLLWLDCDDRVTPENMAR